MLSIAEMRLILLGGALKNVADFYQYSLLGATSLQIKSNEHSFAPFYFGQVSGMLLAGLSNDLLFRECQFLVVTTINIVTILWNFWDIVYPEHNTDVIAWTLTLLGISNGFSDTYLQIMLPMTIADNHRVLAYELTMLGTIFALVQVCFYISTSLVSSFIIEVI